MWRWGHRIGRLTECHIQNSWVGSKTSSQVRWWRWNAILWVISMENHRSMGVVQRQKIPTKLLMLFLWFEFWPVSHKILQVEICLKPTWSSTVIVRHGGPKSSIKCYSIAHGIILRRRLPIGMRFITGMLDLAGGNINRDDILTPVRTYGFIWAFHTTFCKTII